SSLREAVKALEVVRILDIRQGDGTYVTELNTQHLSEAISFVVELHQNSSVLELLETRRVLEAAAVELAAARISEAQLEKIQRTLDDTDVETIDSLVDQDLAFHGIIGDAAGNGYLSSLTASLNSRT
ncbi:UNVERIFIED_CONTAM: FCD domain-containing protein, partial [Acinetobacter sp. HSTU-ASm16]